MYFPPRYETDERRFNGGGFEIYEMLQTPCYRDDQFLIIVVVRLAGSGGDFCYVFFGDGEDLEWLVQWLQF